MKKIKQIATTFFVSSIMFAQQLYAADVGNFYIGAQLGSSRMLSDGPKNDVVFIANQEFNTSDSAYGFYAGFQFNDWFSAELSLNDYGSPSYRFKFKDGIFFLVQPNDTQTIEAKGASLLGVFNYKVTPNLLLLGVLGVATVDYEITQSGGFSPFTGNLLMRDKFAEQGLVYGLGTKYALSDSLSLRLDLRRNEVGDFTLQVASLGIEYGF